LPFNIKIIERRREMSFICGFCGKQQPNGVGPIKIPTIVETRPLPPAQKEVDNPDRVNEDDKNSIRKWSTQVQKIAGDDWPRKLILAYSREERRIIEEKDACPACAANPPEPEVIEYKFCDEKEKLGNAKNKAGGVGSGSPVGVLS
jgi:hypothetical protein